ncbi:MAG: DJ-1/PfpI family protein [Candidatus Dependentiae bacterium]
MNHKKVLLVIAYDGYQPVEYGIPKKTLQQAGFQVVTASNKAGIATAKDQSTTNVDITLEQVNVADYEGIFFVGGPGALDNLDHEASYDLINQAFRQEKIIGAICIATRILAASGVLTAHAATGWDGDDKLADIYREYEVYYLPDQKVVTQGNIITATGPEAAQDFADQIVRMLTRPLP